MAGTVVLDSNLAILFAVGQTNRAYIALHKRLRAVYEPADFAAVCNLIARFSRLLFTPNVLSETSNLMRQIDEPRRSEIAAVFADIVRRCDEAYVPSRSAVDHAEHIRLGLTDAVLLRQAEQRATLLTVDVALWQAALRAGLPAINCNHLRDLRLTEH